MSLNQNSSLENNIRHLNMMFEVSTIANQTDDVFELLAKIKEFCSNIINSDDISFYLLEDQRYKCMSVDSKTRSNEFVEVDESNSVFWNAVNKAKLTSMKDGSGAHLFKSFLEKNNILSLDPSHVRVFFNNQVPVCFCFIKENPQTPIDAQTVEDLNKIFDYIEPIVAKYHKRIKKDEEIADRSDQGSEIPFLFHLITAL